MVEMSSLRHNMTKNCFIKVFPIFLKKVVHENENFNKNLILLKHLIDLEKIHQNRVSIRFLPKFIFYQNFLFEKRKKFKQKIFLAYLNKLEKI